MCLIIRSLFLVHQSGMDLYCWILAFPSLMTTTGQLPTRALSMPNRSLPHHSASPKMCLPLPPAFMAVSTASGSVVPAFVAASDHRSMMEAYSHDTALHSPSPNRFLNS